MATPTVVCPECGSPTTPGRYTCSNCGAFLDGVTVTPRSWAPEPESLEAHDAVAAPVDASATAPATAIDLEPPVSAADPLPEPEDLLLEDGPTLEPAARTLPPAPDVLHEVEWPAPEDRPAYAPASPPFVADAPAVASAPPALPRTPAGSWLPPSGLLTGLDDGSVGADASGAAVAAPLAPLAAPRRSMLGGLRGEWASAFGSAEQRSSTARRTIAIGAAITLVGFLLPWASASFSTLLSVWTNVWWLAGAGHWLVLLVVAALGFVASSARAAALPLGTAAWIVAAFLLGLIWPTLLGAANRPIGILVVLVGAIAIAAGGALQPGPRHEAATPDV